MWSWFKRLAAPVAAIAIFGVLASPQAVRADALPPGGIIPGLPSVNPNTPTAGLLVASIPAGVWALVDINSLTTATGTYSVKVYKSTAAGQNFFGIGFLTFIFNYSVTTGPDEINRVTVDQYAGFSVQAWATHTANPDTSSVDRSGGTGNVIGMNYAMPNTLVAGNSSETFAFDTNATNFTIASINFFDGGVSTNPSFGPTANAPLPATAGMGLSLIGGLGLLALARRKATVA